jgi:hypothetical protein
MALNLKVVPFMLEHFLLELILRNSHKFVVFLHLLCLTPQGLQEPRILERIERLQQKFQGVKVLVGVDRLDYIKGVPQKLHALEVFLEKHPEFQEKVGKAVHLAFHKLDLLMLSCYF